MYGPLVMASPDIHTWEEASLTLSPTLTEVKETGKAPFTLEVLGRKFVPDYYISDEQSTHYLRLDIPSGQRKASASGTLDTEELKRMLTAARERKASEWAPHGFRRLQERMAEGEALMAKANDKEKGLTQSDVDYAASALNVAIISMRPANLAEPEDLSELTARMEEVRQQGASTPELRAAMDYARMVVRYVNDGSGTRDMIAKALKGLKR